MSEYSVTPDDLDWTQQAWFNVSVLLSCSDIHNKISPSITSYQIQWHNIIYDIHVNHVQAELFVSRLHKEVVLLQVRVSYLQPKCYLILLVTWCLLLQMCAIHSYSWYHYITKDNWVVTSSFVLIVNIVIKHRTVGQFLLCMPFILKGDIIMKHRIYTVSFRTFYIVCSFEDLWLNGDSVTVV